MDKETKILSVALGLMLLSFPLTSFGTENEQPALWITGLVVLVLGALAAPVIRYLPAGSDDDDDEEGDT